MSLNPNSKIYRLSTLWHSFKALYNLTPAQVSAFLKSYEIYDCDWVNGQAMKDNEKVEYEQVKTEIINYYSVLNFLCAIAQVEKMYIPPTLDLSAGVIDNQILFEKRFSQSLEMKPENKILDIGCGKGRVAAHLADFTGAHITGINIDPTQLRDANDFTLKNNLSDRCKFMNKDFNDLPLAFPDNYFNSIYDIQAFSYCRDIEKLFIELYRVLKPGGKFSFLEWVRLPAYDENNPHHVSLMKKIKPLIGAIGTPSPQQYESALSKAGFEILVSEDPSIGKSQNPLTEKSATIYSKFYSTLKFLVKIKVLPTHIILLIDRFGKDVEALYEADELGLVTTSYHLVAQKPKS